ncbi:hypothetical protein HII31_07643 [Pseudocercospora fuligena]|uniref:Bacteriorhodopsin n=1 Tax=Pseudocercospora fuligena TaxID=685502 RepID=A0A8H6RGB0_9PEZI|nr:hypothetical protein HII31_07643 [Pseudocercospora fuligena]
MSRYLAQIATVALLAGSVAANSALEVNTNTQNGKTVQIAITVQGSDFYYAICAIMGATCIGILAAAQMKPRTDRVFFYLCASITMVATIAYYAMGSNLGWTPIDVEFPRTDPVVRGRNREIFYARYIDWVITTPLLLTDLLLTAGMPWPSIVWTVLLDELMVVTGLVGALTKSRYKWGFFAFGCAAMLFVFWELAMVARPRAKKLGNDVHRTFLICGVLTLFIWMLYPIAWGLCEGGNVISADSEAVFYGVLDFIAKPIFSIMLLFGHWNIDPARLGLRIPDYNGEDAVLHEKKELHGNGFSGSNGVTNGNGVANGATSDV